MKELEQALSALVGAGNLTGKLALILMCASESGTISYQKAEEIAGDDTEDALLTGLEWKLLIPVRTSRCGEWDDRLFMAEPGEVYEMPNVSRLLVKNACCTGKWDSAQSIADFFESAGEPQWRLIPALVRRMREGCPAVGINARQLKVACREMGFGERTDTLIAILKGAGVISPKLGSLAHVTRTQTPLYEMNPCLFAKAPAIASTKMTEVRT
jgi:hypothetical protein